MNRNDEQFDEPLDQLLSQAIWPENEADSLRRLESHWDSVLQDDGHAKSAITVASRKENSGNNTLAWILAAAALLLIGAGFSMLLTKLDAPVAENSKDRTESVPPESNLRESNQPESSQPISPQPGDSMAENNDKEETLSADQYLAALATSSQRKRSKTAPTASSYRKAVEYLSGQIGRSPWLAAATQTAIRRFDRFYAEQARTRQISSRQWKKYLRERRQWETWAWQLADSKKSQSQVGALRFAIALSSDNSLRRLENLLLVDGVANDAALAISDLGQARHIDRAISIVSTDRSKRTLLLALLDLPGRQPAMIFLKRLRDPETSELANAIANSTDQLPTDVWLNSIARHDRSRWDSALAVANVCDQRVTRGLIELALDPTTSPSAMMALVKSKCDDARQFIAYAESNHQLSDGVLNARRRLQRFEAQALRVEQREDINKM